MKKLILFVTAIAVLLTMASCKTFGADDKTVSGDSSTNTTSTEDTVGESSNGITPDDNVVEFPFSNDNSSEAEAVGGDESQIGDTSSAEETSSSSSEATSSDSAETTSSSSSEMTSSTSTETSSSATSSEAEGGNSGTSGDNEGAFDPTWNTNGSSSTASDVEVNDEPVTTPEGEDGNSGKEEETSSEDPDGPGWIDGWY